MHATLPGLLFQYIYWVRTTFFFFLLALLPRTTFMDGLWVPLPVGCCRHPTRRHLLSNTPLGCLLLPVFVLQPLTIYRTVQQDSPRNCNWFPSFLSRVPLIQSGPLLQGATWAPFFDGGATRSTHIYCMYTFYTTMSHITSVNKRRPF